MWQVIFDDRAKKEFEKLDQSTQDAILTYMETRIATDQDPKRFGKPLMHNKRGLWRYRVGDYRVICKIVEDQFLVIAVKIGHRKEVYDD